MKLLLSKQIEEKNKKLKESIEFNKRYDENVLRKVNEFQYERDEQLKKDKEKIFMYKESLDRQIINQRTQQETYKDNQIKLINKPIINEILNYYQ